MIDLLVARRSYPAVFWAYSFLCVHGPFLGSAQEIIYGMGRLKFKVAKFKVSAFRKKFKANFY